MRTKCAGVASEWVRRGRGRKGQARKGKAEKTKGQPHSRRTSEEGRGQAHLLCRLKIDIANKAASRLFGLVRNGIDAAVNHNCTGLDPVPLVVRMR